MNDIGIFIVGALMFIATAWATIAFGLTRFQELQRLDRQAAEATATVRSESSFTEVWVPANTEPDDTD